MHWPSTESLLEDLAPYAVSGIGLLLLSVGAGSTLLDGVVSEAEHLQLVALATVNVGLIGLGVLIARTLAAPADVLRVLGWTGAGVIALAALAAWFWFAGRFRVSPFRGALLYLTGLGAGALFGSAVGYYDVRARAERERAGREEARQEFLREQQAALSTLNGILRHQLLNDIGAITGQAELLEADRVEPEAAADTVLEHSEHVVEVLHRVELISDALAGTTDLEPRDVTAAVDHAVADLRESHPGATVERRVDGTPTARADHLLSLAVLEVLENAAHFAGPEATISIHVRTESRPTTGSVVVVEVTDDGPGLDVEPVERALEPSVRGTESPGDGLGLFLAATIVERYGGTVEIGSSGEDPAGGATVCLCVPAT